MQKTFANGMEEPSLERGIGVAEVNIRRRLLALIDIFVNETDEDHQLSLQDIKEKLKLQFGSDYNVKDSVLREDLDAISQTLMSLTVNNGPHGKKYFSFQERLFERYELRMLIDAVVSARFITKKDAKRLISKIKKLASRYEAKKLNQNLYVEDTVKSESDTLKYDIDQLHNAISENKKVLFQYGTYDVNKKFVLHRDGEWYSVKPYSLIWYNDFYYLVGEYEKLGEVRHYRVDRMRRVTVKEETFKRPTINIGEYVKKSFQMFTGPEEWIELQVSNHLFNVMLDRFGLDINITQKNDDSFVFKTKAAMSDGLIGWLLSWGSDVKVLAPDALIERLKERTEKMYHLYHS